MTKREIEKCENLMHEAIRYAKESKEELEKAMSEKDKTEREILHSKGVQHYGYKLVAKTHRLACGMKATYFLLGFCIE